MQYVEEIKYQKNHQLFGILNIIWRETKARLSTHATQKSKMAGLLVGVACVLSLAFVFAPNNIKNNEYLPTYLPPLFLEMTNLLASLCLMMLRPGPNGYPVESHSSHKTLALICYQVHRGGRIQCGIAHLHRHPATVLFPSYYRCLKNY